MFSTRNIPNLITISRIVAVIGIFGMVPFSSNVSILWAVVLYTLAGITDYVDGWIARRFGLVSDAGKVLDPLADKILVLVFLPLLQMQVIHFFPVFVIFAREFAIMALRVIVAKKGQNVSASFSGKLKTAVTLPVCGILFGRIAVPEIMKVPVVLIPIEWLRLWVASWPQWTIDGLVWATVLVTIGSFFDYLWRFFWQRTLDKAHGDPVIAKRRLLVVFPNAITMMNLGCGVAATYFAYLNQLMLSGGLILLGIYFDAFDGRLARRWDVHSKFGANLDSRADFVTFGIAPAILIYRALTTYLGSLSIHGVSIPAVAVAVAYYASVHFRLRRFNKTGHSDFFEGLPSPIGAAVVSISVTSFIFGSPTFLIPLCLMISGLMISKLPYPHLNRMLQNRIIKPFKIPALLCFLLTIAADFGAHRWITWKVGEFFLIFVGVYLTSPLKFFDSHENR